MVPEASPSGTLMLLGIRRLVLGHDISRNPAALLDIDAVLARPGADSHSVYRAGLATTTGGRLACRPATDLAGVLDVLAERRTQLVSVLGVQVNLELATVQGEPDSALRSPPSMSSMNKVWIF